VRIPIAFQRKSFEVTTKPLLVYLNDTTNNLLKSMYYRSQPLLLRPKEGTATTMRTP